MNLNFLLIWNLPSKYYRKVLYWCDKSGGIKYFRYTQPFPPHPGPGIEAEVLAGCGALFRWAGNGENNATARRKKRPPKARCAVAQAP
ncbi:hypothetical protein PEDI_39040 [Persicobacter diffluens]|uniref:Uncharacterized protein n=1 Tax=Persicobacter diffluens TaxID=981 RepID=A0AAN4W1I4_9BACT|nr:hypothetical protein PEDI_39040 [Persicobacter diffluens]